MIRETSMFAAKLIEDMHSQCTLNSDKIVSVVIGKSIVTDGQARSHGMHMSVGDHYDDDESLFGLASHSDSEDDSGDNDDDDTKETHLPSTS